VCQISAGEQKSVQLREQIVREDMDWRESNDVRVESELHLGSLGSLLLLNNHRFAIATSYSSRAYQDTETPTSKRQAGVFTTDELARQGTAGLLLQHRKHIQNLSKDTQALILKPVLQQKHS
jgi:hypothetical protein